MSFKTWLESAAIPPGEEIIIGKHAVMVKLYPFIGEHSQSDKGKSGGHAFTLESNPDMIVACNPKKRQFARGTWNCLVCKHRQPQGGGPDVCDEPFNNEQTHVITQKWLFDTDLGGCVFVDCYPILGRTQPVNTMVISSLYVKAA